ncbi:MAG: polysaccharide deacetylase family protein [Spirochaetes bacterium]|nr:polysaccharide deacetylase family protein [Spirochaetota bacterium]
MSGGPTLCPLAPAHLAGIGAIQAAAALAFIDLRLAAVPLALFILACLAAPFFPRSRFYLPVISRGGKRRRAVALTFDDGPDPSTTQLLLELLARHDAPAAFFVTGSSAEAHPVLMREIIDRGHEVCNHSYSHSPFLMLKGTATLRREIASAQSTLAGFGVTPLAFRPPVGITSPRLWRVLLEAGMFCVNFSRRARDAGNRRIGALSKKILKKTRPGDIILLHDVSPGGGFDAERWLQEIEKILIGLKNGGFEILPLSFLLNRPVMSGSAANDTAAGPVRAFYDSIAFTYDGRQRGRTASPAARKERDLFENNLLKLVGPGDRVLELGAGTGLFTIPVARRCREITAIDISPGMLAALEEKAAEQNITNILRHVGDIRSMEPDKPYDVICSFSAFEYLPDLGELFVALAEVLRPGGVLYFTTAHRSFFRFFTQIGNAMRQGVWLHARSKRSIRSALLAAGFVIEQLSTHVLIIPLTGGMLIEVLARREGGRN